MAIRPFHLFAGLLLPLAAPGLVHAAELGEARVLSYIGQPLAAEVELTSIEDASKPVQAQLARRDVYRGANVAMPPVLSGLDIAVIRHGAKQFLRLASVKPVESKHLHVYLELVDGGQRSVRLVTLWLAPDPNPAPPPVPVAVPEPAPVLAPVPAPPAPAVPVAPAAVTVQPAKAARAAAPLHKPAPPKRRPTPVQAAAGEHPAAEAAHAAPSKPAIAAAGPAAKPDTEAAKPVGSPAACAPAPAAAELNACAVLGAKNEALRQEVGQLEDKVKVLQVATGVKSASEADAETVARANAQLDAQAQAKPGAEPDAKPDAKPKSAPRIHRKPKPAAPPEEPLPWLAIGGALAGLLALAGLFLVWRRRRGAAGKELKTAREPEVVVLPQDGGAARPSFMSVLKARLAALRPRKRPAQAARTEPQGVEDQPLASPLTQPE